MGTSNPSDTNPTWQPCWKPAIPHGCVVPSKSTASTNGKIANRWLPQVCRGRLRLLISSLEKIILSLKIRKLLTFKTVCSKQAVTCSHAAEESTMKATEQRRPAWEASCPAKSLQHWLHKAWRRHFMKIGVCTIRHLLSLLILTKTNCLLPFLCKATFKVRTETYPFTEQNNEEGRS